nr:MAG TPA: hypothetical protein [Caudoviricetes sp.]
MLCSDNVIYRKLLIVTVSDYLKRNITSFIS